MAEQKKPFTLPPLPYAKDALAPHISAETLEYHYGKHHATYVNKLNQLVENSDWSRKSLVELIKTAPPGPIFNNAAQAWNHTFYWESMKPPAQGGGGPPHGPIKDLIERKWGTFDKFKEEFSNVAAGHFGSGWAWLCANQDGSVEIVQTHDAANPIQQNKIPLLTCDVWEHAYYIDYRNARPEYIKAWWGLINWDFANKNLASNPASRM